MRRFTAAVLSAVVLVATATACTAPSRVVDGSTVTVASPQAFTSFNDHTRFGNTPANAAIVAATNAGFGYYDDGSAWVEDTSFGTVEVAAEQPLTVRFTVAEGVRWSDGTPVDGADLLLAWAADSGALNTPDFDPGALVDAEGQFAEFPADTVYFDGALHAGLEHVTSTPELGEDGRSITLVFDEYVPDFRLAFRVGLPAHVVASEALPAVRAEEGETAAQAAKRALVTAITDEDTEALARLSATWNSAFNVTADATPDPALLVGSGPYSVAEVAADTVTLRANPEYTGDRRPRYETVVVRTITDPLAAVAALRDGEVDVVAPTPTPDVLDALEGVDGVTVSASAGGAFEHLDLQVRGGRSGVFSDARVREAFLLTVPRERIVEELVAPLDPEAVVRDSFTLAPGREGYEEVVSGNGSADHGTPDPARARRLLERAGVTAPEVCILFDPANPRRVAEFTLIAESAGEAGFVVSDCSRGDWEQFLGVPDTYDAALFAWNETTDARVSAAARLGSGSTISNFSGYASETVDGLLAELAVTTDPVPVLAAIDEELWKDAYGLPLYQFPTLVAHRDDVTGVSPSPLGAGLFWNVWEWQPAQHAAE